MNDVNALTSAIRTSLLPHEAADTRADAQAAGSSRDPLDMAELLAQARLDSLPRSTGKADETGAIPVTNANGAPQIDENLSHFCAQSLEFAVMALRGKMLDVQARTAKEGLHANQDEIDRQHAEAKKKLDAYLKDLKKAENKSKLGKILSWVGRVGAFVGAVAMIVASGGTAAPALAMPVVALVGSTVSIASAASQEAGGPALEINSLLNKGCMAFLQQVGVPEDKLEAASHIMAGAMGVGMGAAAIDPQVWGDLASGITQMITTDQTKAAIVGAVFTAVAAIAVAAGTSLATGGASAVEAGANAAKSIPQIAKIVQGSTQVVSGVSSAAAGGLNVSVALDEHASEMAQAAHDAAIAWVAFWQANFEQGMQELDQVLKNSQQNFEQTSQMLADAGTSYSQIVANMVPSRG